jgi:site-specific DNA-methyltransferase (adenine-specific)
MIQTNYNPDVLTCLANLSNDEVFTPPSLVNDILDLLPAELWSNPNAKFLDPVSKSGVFLREMAKRLMHGLETQIPDKQERINHIFSQQLYGIAITDLTALLSRRSVYCSKTANGKYSICETFDDEQGNIRYQRMKHTWQNGKCTYCGASQEVYDRDDALETYAYNFIHTDKPYNIFNMKFDVIVGNPPYQLNVGIESKAFAISIYDKFVMQAIKLNPRYLAMIIPARWYAGGRGLDEFRKEMLNDRRVKTLVDYTDSIVCFPGVEIKGGVCYFLWDREYNGDCTIISHRKENLSPAVKRPLLEKGMDTFVRYNEAISILNKVIKLKEKSFSDLVSVQTPFGFISSFKNFKTQSFAGAVKLYAQNKIGYVKPEQIEKGQDLVDKHKIYISKSYNAGENFPHQIINKPFKGEKNSCCTQTYIAIGPFKSEKETENAITYMATKFFRFIVMLKKISQDAMRGVYSIVPIQDFTEPWTDEKLYMKYGLSEEEIAFIYSMIRPMNLTQHDDTD